MSNVSCLLLHGRSTADLCPAYAAPPSLVRYTSRPFGHRRRYTSVSQSTSLGLSGPSARPSVHLPLSGYLPPPPKITTPDICLELWGYCFFVTVGVIGVRIKIVWVWVSIWG